MKRSELPSNQQIIPTDMPLLPGIYRDAPPINMSLTTIIYPRRRAPLVAPGELGPGSPPVASLCGRDHVCTVVYAPARRPLASR